MDIPAGWVKAFDSEAGGAPDGWTASSGAHFSLPSGYRGYYAWPVGDDDPPASSPAPDNNGGAAKTLRVTSLPLPSENPDLPSNWTYAVNSLLSNCIIEAEFSGLSLGSNVILELGWCLGRLPTDSGGDNFSRSPWRIFVILEYKGDGYWCIGSSAIGWI